MAARSAPAAARRRARPGASDSRDAPDDGRADESREGHRQPLPRPDRETIFRVLWTDIRDRAPLARPVIPIERYGAGAPLLFESIGAPARRRPSEIEDLEPLATRVFQGRTVQEHVGREAVVTPVG